MCNVAAIAVSWLPNTLFWWSSSWKWCRRWNKSTPCPYQFNWFNWSAISVINIWVMFYIKPEGQFWSGRSLQMSHHGRQVFPGFWSSSDVADANMPLCAIMSGTNTPVPNQLFAFATSWPLAIGQSSAGRPILDRAGGLRSHALSLNSKNIT